MFDWLMRWWRKRKRAIDLEILWPECKKRAPDMELAKAAFAVHAFRDSAWTEDFDDPQLVAFIDELK